MANTRIGSGFRRIAWIGLALVIAMTAMTVWLANRPPTTNCDDGSWLSPSDHVVLAAKVIAKPWYGRHNIFGVFIIPAQYRDTKYSAIVTVRGVKEYAEISPRPVKEHGIAFPDVPDRFLRHAHVQTRVALWFLLTGRFGDLRNTCNWALVFSDKKS